MLKITAGILMLALCTAVAFAQNTVDSGLPKQNLAEQQATPPAAKPLKVRVAGAVMLGLVQRKTMPVYPDEAMLKGIQGDVLFKVAIDNTGKPVLAVPVEGDPLLLAASVEALKDTRFRPYQLNGTPVNVETQLGFHFSVEKKDGSINGNVECITSVPDRPEFRTGVVTDAGVIVLDPHKISGAAPTLPPELEGKSGSVYLKITVGTDGKVQDVKVISGDQPFIGPVVAAVKQEVYEPRLVDGQPSVATIEASYHFGPRQ
ncbi:MAG: energy transducer TonB [Terriglobales bacterium]